MLLEAVRERDPVPAGVLSAGWTRAELVFRDVTDRGRGGGAGGDGGSERASVLKLTGEQFHWS